MTPSQNFLFPLILGILSQKPQLSEAQAELFKDLAKKLKADHIKVNNLKETLDSTIELGKGLGILTVQDGKVRMLFQMKGPRTFALGVPTDSELAPRTNNNTTLPIYKKLINKQRNRRKPKKQIESNSRQRNRHSAVTKKKKGVVKLKRF